MIDTTYFLVKKLKKRIKMPFYLRPFRKRVEEAIDILARSQAGKNLLRNIKDAPKEIQVKLLPSSELGSYSYSKKTLSLNCRLLRKDKKEELACVIGHELFHKMLYDQKMALCKKRTSPSQFVNLELLNEAATKAFEKTLMMEISPEKARQDSSLSEYFKIFEKTKKESNLQIAHKKTQALIFRNLLTDDTSFETFFWFKAYRRSAICHVLSCFVYEGDRISYEGNHKSYQNTFCRYMRMYSPFLKTDELSTQMTEQGKDIQRLTDKIHYFKTERPKKIRDTPKNRRFFILNNSFSRD
ncbi:MAG: hypothetical protein IJC30_00725 [Alphaproteobacteria bacterium]|nr:hypothetical protein [Alphaproteobacteria bacterium]